MNSVCLIDERLFNRYLEVEVGLRLPPNARGNLSPAIAFWNETEDLQDLRRLALGLSDLLELKKNGAPKNTKSAAPTNAELNDTFRAPDDKAVESVGLTDNKTATTKPEFANIFYSALVRMSPISLAQVLDEELKRIKMRPQSGSQKTASTNDGGDKVDSPPEESSADPTELQGVFTSLHKARLNALCFSGGGIRSATFGLGIVQALSQKGLLHRFHYLSTVSGGGYLGSWLSAWICREQGDNKIDRTLGVRAVEEAIVCRTTSALDDPNPEPPQLQHLREYSNYMSPKKGLLSADTWTLFAIYLRNLLLNLLIFVPSITAILLLPRFLFRAVVYRNAPSWLELALLIIAAVAGSSAIAFVIGSLPSKTQTDGTTQQKEGGGKFKKFLNTDPGVLAFGVAPLLISAFVASVLWNWHVASKTKLDEYGMFRLELPDWINYGLGYFLIVTTVAYVIGLVAFIVFRLLLKRGRPERDFKAAAAAFVSSLIGGYLLWLVAVSVFPRTGEWFVSEFGVGISDRYLQQLYVSISVPIFLIVVLIAASIYVGLTSRPATDEDREWLARYGAWILILCGVWFGLNVLVLIGPSIWQWLFRFHWTKLFTEGLPATITSLIAAISGIVALVGGFSGRTLVKNEPAKTRTSLVLGYLPKIAAVIFLISIFVALAYLATALFYATGAVGILDHVTALHEVRIRWLIVAFVALGLIGFAMACFVNVNKFSLHGAYRDRLVRAYLGASNKDRKQNTFTGFDDKDNLELHELADQQPLHIINGTVNLVGGKNLAWQNRKAASFTMSALHCGSWAVNGYRRSKEYCRTPGPTGRALRLGTAMAISGAAANPNMGYYSSSIVTFLMSLFNIRLGWWLGNTGEPGSAYHWFGRGSHRFFEKVGPSIAVLPLLNETLGRTDESKKFLMVTDGGHFENLAVYEMVLRRCKLIVLSDGAADVDFKFGEIANAIQKCKVDLGVDIEFLGSMNIRARSKEEGDKTPPGSRFAIARITYPETYWAPVLDKKGNPLRDKKTGEVIKEKKNYVGWLLYTRPTYYRNEPRDIMNYAESNEKFPHQSTGDQMYDEKQFEAYRGLGYFTMSEIRGIFDATSKGDPDDLVDDELEALFAREKDMRETLFGFFNLPDADGFETRARKRNYIPVPPFPVG